MQLLFLLPSALGATAADMANAMAVPGSDVVSTTVTGQPQAYDVLTNLGILSPTEGHDFAYLFTGQIGIPPEIGTDLGAPGVAGDRTGLQMELDVPATANSFTIDFYFLSAEYPEFVGTQYNDTFKAEVTGTAWSGNAAIDSSGNSITINSALFTVTAPPDLQNTGFDHTGGGTGWLTAIVPADPLDRMTLNLLVYDMADGIYDSSVMLDNFNWSTADVDVPVILEEVALEFLSPKRGPIAGGVQTTIIGSGFIDGCTAFFDGVEAPTVFVDSISLLAAPLGHASALVDVEVDCSGSRTRLIGGYTYFDSSDPVLEPTITFLSPYYVHVDGGEQVTVTGTDFEDGATVQVDGVDHVAVVVDTSSLTFETTPHDEGTVQVVVVNPSGALATRDGGLQFMDPPTWPPEDNPNPDSADTGDTGDSGLVGSKDSTSINCSSRPAAPSTLWAGLALLLGLRRRR